VLRRHRDQHELTVEVLDRWLQPLEISDLVISTDIDGNGRYVPLASIGVRSVKSGGD
jgi:hypothetical protein